MIEKMKKSSGKKLGNSDDVKAHDASHLSGRFWELLGELQTESARISEFEQVIAVKERENKQLKAENEKLANRLVDIEAMVAELENLKQELKKLKESNQSNALTEENIKELKASNEFLARSLLFSIAVVPLGLYAESQNMAQLIEKFTNQFWSKL